MNVSDMDISKPCGQDLTVNTTIPTTEIQHLAYCHLT